MLELNSSWLAGKHEINGYKIEINVSLSYVAINSKTESFFFQDEEANEVINQIFDIWNNSEMKQDEAIYNWINLNL